MRFLARTDEERVLFAEIDRERNLTSDYGKGRQSDRLFDEHELPEEYQEEYLKQAIEPRPSVRITAVAPESAKLLIMMMA